MMSIIFLLLSLIIILVWFGLRPSAMSLLLFTLVLSTSLFIHHMTSQLNLNL